MPIKGGCLCGAVRFAIEAPLFTRQCWCRVCQYIGAGSGTVNAFFNKDAGGVSGLTTDFVCRADSGSTIHRSFCAKCGTPLFAEAEERPKFIGVRVGTLDDPNLAKPSAVIWTKSAPAWAYLDPELPQTEGQPSGPPKT